MIVEAEKFYACQNLIYMLKKMQIFSYMNTWIGKL